MGNPFKLLKILSVIFRILAWVGLVIAVVGIVGVLVAPSTPEVPARSALVANLVISALLFFLVFYTVGEIIRVLLAIEQNTRKP